MTTDARFLLAEALNSRAEDLPAQPDVGNTPGWDSLAHTRVILSVEAHLGRQLTTEEIATIGSLADIEAILGGATVR